MRSLWSTTSVKHIYESQPPLSISHNIKREKISEKVEKNVLYSGRKFNFEHFSLSPKF